MYTLYLVTTSQSWEWYDLFLSSLKLMPSDHVKWQQQHRLVKGSDTSSEDLLINGKLFNVYTETWNFNSKEDLINFYNNYTSDDRELNLNRPYAWKDGAVAVKNAGAEFKFYIKNPDKSEELLYNNSDYLVAV